MLFSILLVLYKPRNIVIVVFVITVIGGGGVIYSQGYSEILSPEPKIAIAEVSISYHQLGCYVNFELVNSGETTVFVDVDINSGYLFQHNQYLAKANTIEEKGMWINEISPDNCDHQKSKITISRIIEYNSYVDDIPLKKR